MRGIGNRLAIPQNIYKITYMSKVKSAAEILPDDLELIPGDLWKETEQAFEGMDLSYNTLMKNSKRTVADGGAESVDLMEAAARFEKMCEEGKRQSELFGLLLEHDISEPRSAISMKTCRLDRDAKQTKKIEEIFKPIHKTMVDTIRYSLGRMMYWAEGRQLETAQTNMRCFLSKLLPCVQYAFSAYNNEERNVSVECHGEYSLVQTNPDVIASIAINAAINAMNHGKAKNLALMFASSSRWAAISILDDGSGMEPGIARRASEFRYTQTSSRPGSRGLGLAGALEQMEAIGGEFSIDGHGGLPSHTGEGAGANMTMSFPLAE